MSLRRGGKNSQAYRDQYLRSRAWIFRRSDFIDWVIERDGYLACACCLQTLNPHLAQVHHLDYSGVSQMPSGRWVSREADEDLIQLCAWCHEQIHLVMDADLGWSSRSRAGATREIIRRIQLRLAAAGVAALKERDKA